jgi:hypothetical protein
MSKSDDDVLTLFVMAGFMAVCGFILSYAIGTAFLIMLFIFVSFGGLLFLVILEVVASETGNVNREVNRAIRRNDGNIDGAKIRFGDTDVYVEGPRNSFGKGLKYLFTGKEDYSAKFRIGGHEVGKIKTSSDGTFKFKFNWKG